MGYLSEEELSCLGFKELGEQVKISSKASIYDASSISIGDFSRVDDFCILSGNIEIGKYCHITPMCLIAGGAPGVVLNDFCTIAYGVKIFSQSDDYSGSTMTNSLIPKKYKNETFSKVIVQKNVIIGSGSIVLPGVEIAEGCSIGAMTLVNKSTRPWSVYAGIPGKKVKRRNNKLLDLQRDFLKEVKN